MAASFVDGRQNDLPPCHAAWCDAAVPPTSGLRTQRRVTSPKSDAALGETRGLPSLALRPLALRIPTIPINATQLARILSDDGQAEEA